MKRPIILCVDDDPNILNSLQEQLSLQFINKYEIETAEDGNEAIDLINEFYKNGELLPLVIVDYIMPKTYGNEVLKHLKDIYPNSLSILLTGQVDDVEITKEFSHLCTCLRKPWDKDELIKLIQKGLK